MINQNKRKLKNKEIFFQEYIILRKNKDMNSVILFEVMLFKNHFDVQFFYLHNNL